jgi:hypothetical protein
MCWDLKMATSSGLSDTLDNVYLDDFEWDHSGDIKTEPYGLQVGASLGDVDSIQDRINYHHDCMRYYVELKRTYMLIVGNWKLLDISRNSSNNCQKIQVCLNLVWEKKNSQWNPFKNIGWITGTAPLLEELQKHVRDEDISGGNVMVFKPEENDISIIEGIIYRGERFVA